MQQNIGQMQLHGNSFEYVFSAPFIVLFSSNPRFPSFAAEHLLILSYTVFGVGVQVCQQLVQGWYI